jgi:hypothetical protein
MQNSFQQVEQKHKNSQDDVKAVLDTRTDRGEKVFDVVKKQKQIPRRSLFNFY